MNIIAPINQPCPCCGVVLLDPLGNHSTGGASKPGDFTICPHCQRAIRFTDDLHLRPVTVDEFTRLPKGTQAAYVAMAATLKAQLAAGLRPRRRT